jgi:DNA-binding transcriptional ArsR family regulator
MKNPFQYGRELGADLLVDRQKEIKDVQTAVTEGGKLFLIGPRRYGKTSILKVSAERAERAGAVVLRFDAEAYPTLELLVRAILAEATARLSGNLKQAGDWARKFFGRLRPEITYNATEGTFSASLGGIAETTDAPTQVPLLVELLNGLEKLAASAKEPVGLIIDEFQKVIELGGESAEGQIRAAIQRHAHVGYVFAGSKTRMMADMTGNPSRPFYHLGERLFLGPVPRDEFAAFLARGFENEKIKADEEAIQLIIDLAEEVPYNIQRLAHACWDAHAGRGGGKLTVAAVRASLERLLREDDAFYTQLWNQLTVVQQKALVAAVREGGVELLSHRVTRAYNLSAPSLSRALGALQEKELLRTEESLGKVRLRLVDPFFGAWIDLIS